MTRVILAAALTVVLLSNSAVAFEVGSPDSHSHMDRSDDSGGWVSNVRSWLDVFDRWAGQYQANVTGRIAPRGVSLRHDDGRSGNRIQDQRGRRPR